MPIDASIPLGIQQVNPMQSLSSMIGIASAKQGMDARAIQMQGQQQQNAQGQMTLQERQNLAPFLSDSTNYTNDNGDVDMGKFVSAASKLAPTTWPEYATRLLDAQEKKTQAQRILATQGDEDNVWAGNALASATKETLPKVISLLKERAQGLPDRLAVINTMESHMNAGLDAAGNDPLKQERIITGAARMFLPQPTQQQMNTPEGIGISDNQQSSVVSQKPGTSVPQGLPLPGTSMQMRLPPQTPTMGKDENGNPVQGYLGSQNQPQGPVADFSGVQGKDRKAILNDIANNHPDKSIRDQARAELSGSGAYPVAGNAKQSFVPSSLPVGQAENIANNVSEMNRHFASLNDQASGAPLATALTGNIKALASSAITGTESGKKAYVTGLLNALHMGGQTTGDLQKDTDLLEKNLAQLNLTTPASTDAARTLVSAARPHTSMSEKAILEAADQLSGQVKANMAMRNVLQSAKMMGDTSSYASMRQRLEQTADPRIWQLEGKSPQDQAAILGKLSPQDRSDIVKKARQLHDMGIIQ